MLTQYQIQVLIRTMEDKTRFANEELARLKEIRESPTVNYTDRQDAFVSSMYNIAVINTVKDISDIVKAFESTNPK